MTRVGPYELLEEIGAGSMGRVFRARDTQGGVDVAVKAIRRGAQGDELYAIKREFRLIASLSSPHLLPVYDLFVDSEGAHLVMPLLQGQTLERWASGRDLRDELMELVRLFEAVMVGLSTLHAAGLVHRDVKPSNVMIEPDGRVLLLDYGLATEHVRPETFVSSSPMRAAGTLAFMPPEAVLGADATPARDLFSVGASLLFCVTGKPPPRRQGFWHVPPEALRERLDAAWADMPDALRSLIERMLDNDPSARGICSEHLETLREISGSESLTPIVARTKRELVGRGEERALLRSALETPGSLTLVRGRSGVGKTSLLAAALQEALESETRPLILSGRCHPGEHIRYRTLDAIVDELTRWLMRCGTRARIELLGDDADSIRHAFPVFERLVGAPAPAPADPEELRRRLGTNLAALLGRVSRTWPTFIVIDDIQWADEDGSKLLLEVLAQTIDAPLSVVVVGQRIPAALLALPRAVLIELSPLDASAAIELVAARRAQSGGEGPSALSDESLLRYAEGNPGVLHHLLDHAELGDAAQSPSLAGLLGLRLEALGPDARDVAHALALQGRPVSAAMLVALGFEEPRPALRELERVGICRPVQGLGHVDRAYEITHDTVRLAIAELVSEEDASALHRKLASALEALALPHEDAAMHWEACGEFARAREHLIAAAREGGRALAFEHAVTCYERALALGGAGVSVETRVELAQVLAWAGRGRDAAAQYTDAAGKTSVSERRSLLARAAIQLLHAGFFDEGLSRAREAFRALGIQLPRWTLTQVLYIAWTRLWMRFRGASFRLAEAPVEPHTQIAEAAYSLSTALVPIDPVLGMYVQAVHVRHSLRSGDPVQLARALALEAGFTAVSGRDAARTRSLLAQARSVLGERNDPRVRALFAISRAGVAWASGAWRECAEAAREAELLARDQCVGAWWELGFSRSVLQDSLRWMGRFEELRSHTHGYVADAVRRGDRFATLTYRTRFVSLLHLVHDEPEAAWSVLQSDVWREHGFHLQHLASMHARADCLLYAGQAAEALAEVERGFVALRWKALGWLPSPRAKANHLLASAWLALAATQPLGQRALALRRARAAIAKARTRGWEFTQVLASLIELGARSLEVQGAQLQSDLDALALRCEALDMSHYALALRVASAPSADARERALEALAGLGVRAPARYAAAVLPGLLPPPPRLELRDTMSLVSDAPQP